METAIPEPDNKCENFRRKDVYGDGRMISGALTSPMITSEIRVVFIFRKKRASAQQR